jgi:hypothetical protein
VLPQLHGVAIRSAGAHLPTIEPHEPDIQRARKRMDYSPLASRPRAHDV